MDDLSDEEAEVEGLVSETVANVSAQLRKLTGPSIQNNEIRKRGFAWLVPIGRLFTDQEEKNDVRVGFFLAWKLANCAPVGG